MCDGHWSSVCVLRWEGRSMSMSWELSSQYSDSFISSDGNNFCSLENDAADVARGNYQIFLYNINISDFLLVSNDLVSDHAITRPWSLYFYPRLTALLLLCVIIVLLERHWFQSLAVSAGGGRTWNIIFSKISAQRPETSRCADVMCTTDRSVSDKFVTTTPQSEHVREPFHHKKMKKFFLALQEVYCLRPTPVALQLLLCAINKPCKTLMTTFIPNSEGHPENIWQPILA